MQHNNIELKSSSSSNSKPKPSLNVLKTDIVDLSAGPKMVTNIPEIGLLRSIFSVTTGSTWRSNNPDHLAKAKKQSADVFLGDINSFGMPMGVLLDGCGRHAEAKEIHAIGEKLMEMLNELASELQGKPLKEEVIIALVKEKYRKLDMALQYKFGSNASFSAVLMYLDEILFQKVLSFGTGDTMTVLRKGKSLHTLIKAVNNSLNHAPIPFPSTNIVGGDLEAALKELQVTIRSDAPNGRIILMTDGAYETLLLQESLSADKSVTYHIVDPAVTLDNYLAEMADDLVRAKFEDKKVLGSTATIGDDTTVAEICVPSMKQCNQLAFVYALKEYMAKRAEERKAPSTTQSALQYVSIYNKSADNNNTAEPQDYAQVKINAAQKMIDALSDPDVVFTKEDVAALRNWGWGRGGADGNLGLGQIVAKFEKEWDLPKAFTEAEKKFKGECTLV